MRSLIYSAIVMAILCYTCRRYKYFINVLIYTAFQGLLPCLIYFYSISISFFFFKIIIAFVFGLAIVFIYSSIVNNSDTPWVVIIGIFINYIVSLAMSFILGCLLSIVII